MNTVKKPTEAEIMEALECCLKKQYCAFNEGKCHLFENSYNGRFLLLKECFDLINRKNARISDLKSSLKQTRQTVTTFESAYAVGVRECAEMVKTHEKTKIGVSLNVLIISEEEVNKIVETLVHSHKCTAKKEAPDNV